jgi:hypothetical protein
LILLPSIELRVPPRPVWTDTREIAENLHRAELTALERSEHIAEWVRLTEGKNQPAQVAPIESKRADGRGHRKEGGINAAVRELSIDRTETQRAGKIAEHMTPEAAGSGHGGDGRGNSRAVQHAVSLHCKVSGFVGEGT